MVGFSKVRPLLCGCTRLVSPDVPASQVRSVSRSIAHTINQYFRTHNSPGLEWLSVVSEVRESIHKQFNYAIFNPYHFNDSVQSVAKNTSAGWYERNVHGCKTKSEVLSTPQGIQRCRKYVHEIKTGKRHNPLPLSTLTTSSAKEDLITGTVKYRNVFVYPVAMITAESMFFEPIRNALPDDWVPKPETHHDRMCGKHSFSLDFSSFDATVHSWFIKVAFKIIRSFFDFSHYEKTGWRDARPKGVSSLDRLFNAIVNYFIHTRIILPDGSILKKSHGVPSGSMFTNLVDTIVSRIVLTYVHRSAGCSARVLTYGDDCHSCNCSCPERYVSGMCARLGFNVKIEPPNEHGCLTYCKAECHEGISFHSGLWYANILSCCLPSLVPVVSYCLLYTNPTREQMLYLYKYSNPRKKIHPALEGYVDRLTEYLVDIKGEGLPKASVL